jgi:hypothetical protein
LIAATLQFLCLLVFSKCKNSVSITYVFGVQILQIIIGINGKDSVRIESYKFVGSKPILERGPMQFVKQTCLEELDGPSSGSKPRGHHGLNADALPPSLVSTAAGAGTEEVA